MARQLWLGGLAAFHGLSRNKRKHINGSQRISILSGASKVNDAPNNPSQICLVYDNIVEYHLKSSVSNHVVYGLTSYVHHLWINQHLATMKCPSFASQEWVINYIPMISIYIIYTTIYYKYIKIIIIYQILMFPGRIELVTDKILVWV